MSIQQQTLARNAHYMREKVADIGTGLQLVARGTELLLRKQQAALEHALSGDLTTPPLPVIYSEEVADHLDAADDTRFSHSAANGLSKVYYPQPTFRLPAGGCANDACSRSVQLLARASGELKNLFRLQPVAYRRTGQRRRHGLPGAWQLPGGL